MSWQTETGSSGTTSETANLSLSRSYLRDMKTLGDGRYRIIKLAGRGGMSQVFHAYDTLNDRDVAIKVLSLDLVSEETFLARFQRESDLMRDLDHPNILRAYDYGQEEDKVYLVMSYYGGGTLKDRLNQGPLSLGQIANYLSQIAAALGYAHSRNIVHRDVKPSNVLIHHAGDNLVLSDFGIAKALSNANPARTGTIMGTPLYMAPEQFLDKVDRRSDIYSLGIVLYQMLTGEVPFKGDGIGFKHLYDPMPPLKTWNVNYDPVIENVVAQALAKRPEARFQHVEEMAEAFRQAITDLAGRITQDVFKGVVVPVQNTTWNNLEEDSAILPGQATLSELAVITPSQLKTDQPVNPLYLEPTTPLSLQELQRFENEPLPFHSLPKSFADPAQTSRLFTDAAPEVTSPELTPVSGPISRAYLPMQSEAASQQAVTGLDLDRQFQPGKAAPAGKTRASARPEKGTISPAIPLKSGDKSLAVAATKTAGSTTLPAKRAGFKWWLAVLPVVLVVALVALVFSLAANPLPGSQAAPVTPKAGLTPAVTPSPVVTTAAASTTAPATTIVSGPGPTTAPVIVPVTSAAAQTAAPAVRNAVIVFTSEFNDEGTYNIYSYDTQTQTTRQLTLTGKDSLAAWSPDGSKLVFQREQSNGVTEVWLMDPDGSKQTKLLSGAMNPEFAHTSLKLVYVNLNDNELYTTTLDKGVAQIPIKLTSTGGKAKSGPAFSNNDKKLAFAMEDDKKIYQIYSLDLTVSNAAPVKLTDRVGENALWPQFSPDNSQIVFSTNDNNPDQAERLPLDIYLINADGSGSQRIVGNTGHNSHPIWVADSSSRDGSRIFFNSDRGASEWARVYSMNPVADLVKADQQIYFDHKVGGQEAPYDDYAPAIFFKK